MTLGSIKSSGSVSQARTSEVLEVSRAPMSSAVSTLHETQAPFGAHAAPTNTSPKPRDRGGLLAWLDHKLSSPRREAFAWPQGELSDAQWQNLVRFSKRNRRPLEEGATIEVLSPPNEPVVGSPSGIQTVGKNGVYENRLLALSRIDERPREVLTIRVIADATRASATETPILVKGNADSVDFDVARTELVRFLGGVIDVDVVEINHTHPSYEVRITDGNSAYRRSNELREGDVAQAKALARSMPAGSIVRLRAIVPNGHFYQMDFPTGR